MQFAMRKCAAGQSTEQIYSIGVRSTQCRRYMTTISDDSLVIYGVRTWFVVKKNISPKKIEIGSAGSAFWKTDKIYSVHTWRPNAIHVSAHTKKAMLPWAHG